MLDDGSAQVEISVFNELFEKHREKLKEDSLLVVAGKVQNDEFSGGLRVAPTSSRISRPCAAATPPSSSYR